MDYAEAALKMHRENHGKLEMASKIPLTTRDELSTAYTPGVAAPCLKIKEDKSEAYTYTAKGNLVSALKVKCKLCWSVWKSKCRYK